MKRVWFAFLGFALSVAQPTYAAWSAQALVDRLNPGGNGLHGTFVVLAGATFSGCTVSTWAWIDGTSPNYKELVATLLAAKLGERTVQVGYSGCSGQYPLVTELLVF
jgi:hypothetical protein